MGRYSRVKGSAFERLVAKTIANFFGFSTKQCYRTPLSGGHKYADRGDITIGPDLAKHFKFTVECKHTKSWNCTHLFAPTKVMEGWAGQVLKASAESGLAPVIVFRGNGGPILAAVPDHGNLRRELAPVCYLRLEGLTWAVQTLDQFLQGIPQVKGKKK